ncbi:UDP-N-acetylmuramoyl-L-alanyl-D-glutamate synthetase [Paucilactobacillus oligofermentans DSM 15707 = LMG 22743]|uniref:UDP-N-acetylmuramoylalanine--D-glutamate ligase n=1 Tax=Paucilactobacillus oligofermentans DSM 15707 = LMG 22743 TaxID=1423778 RepID=A0A0R1RK74_9LACO|nr:UDP-N-acetylmuramoyl-L-alanine--D-glutamate ligase [Paucilactobacillus oligofermentans]KRL54597.1 UDP-N-acetylmuramoyl-L-alanyl-D-glutamate synthetase [Paucilactobacillus oligofermentans DSM 15707 = LMG 22743]CUS26494.1 UDP-N-acetylmuramoyl-L-alanine--D-glutamate ligase MurD [Paucilactobacillus oligofermentans DSM 15707 = LMG 22743]
MRQVDTYKNKKVLVIGLGKSGVGVAKLLNRLGAFVTLNDANTPSDFTQVDELKADNIEVITGSHPLGLVDEKFTLVVKNPGIPYDNPLVAAFLTKKTPIVTEIEIASEVLTGELVAVTGSNGKTTTTTMIKEMLATGSENNIYKAGNIGIPMSDVVQTASEHDTVVAELSSFQLMGTPTLHPHIAVITNIFSNHLDYHKTRENYVNAKMNITRNQTADDFFVINWDDQEWQSLSRRSHAQVIPFSRLGKSKVGAYQENGKLYWQDEEIMLSSDVNVVGEHNIENALAAIAVAKLSGIENDIIKEVLASFGGVRHRMQFVMEYKNREIYNDSKATDIEATEMALNGFNQPVILLAGGLDRGYTFEKLIPSFKEHVKAIILFGEAANKLAAAAKSAGINQIKFSENAETAVKIAFEMSSDGDVILLSPANASWDQYPNFEIRGDKFIKSVEHYTGKEEE